MTGIRKTALSALERAAKELTEIHVKETVQTAGIQRLSKDDCFAVVQSFVRRHPEYRAVKFCTEEQMRIANPSLWETCVLTMNEYDSEEDFLREIGAIRD